MFTGSATLGLFLIIFYIALKFQLQETLPRKVFNKSPVTVIERSRPGFLSNFPVNGSPIPGTIWHRVDHRPFPSNDLVSMGIAPEKGPGIDLDRKYYPNGCSMYYDDLGFPNPCVPRFADTLIIGDSFTWIAGHKSPTGLVSWLKERLPGDNLYNLSESGTGTLKQAWLLDNLGWSFKPKLILWFYYAGNDLMEDNLVVQWESEERLGLDELNITLFDEWQPDKLILRLFTVDPLEDETREYPNPDGAHPVDGFQVRLENGVTHPIWFSDYQFRNISQKKGEIYNSPGWLRAIDALKQANERAKKRGCRLILVYLPSKEQVYLPLIKPDLELFHQFINIPLWGKPKPHKIHRKVSDKLFTQAYINRHNLETMLAEFCQKEQIEWFSTRSYLETAAAKGPDPVFLTSDTHWNLTGQKVILEPLLDHIASSKS